MCVTDSNNGRYLEKGTVIRNTILKVGHEMDSEFYPLLCLYTIILSTTTFQVPIMYQVTGLGTL